MKKIKLLLPLTAFALVLTASAFTFHSKATPKKPTTVLYWYRVTYDAQHPSGAILSSSDFYVQDDKTNVSSPCDAGITKDCLRGFSSQLSSFPSASSGMDQIKKP